MNRRRLSHSVIVAAIVCAIKVSGALAIEAPDIGIAPGGVRFSQTPIVAGTEIKIYATVRNNTAADTRGFVSFLDNDIELGVAPISLKGGGVEEEVWYPWKPMAGQHNIAAIAHLESGVESNTRDNRVDVNVFVDRDSDGDGIPDSDDPDDDNDGISDVSELQHGFDPLDPRDATGDADGDGISNRDEIGRGLNPRSADTDADGSPDGVDAFPLDTKRQRVSPPPAPPSASSSGGGGGGSAVAQLKPSVVSPEVSPEVQLREVPEIPKVIEPPQQEPDLVAQSSRQARQPFWKRLFTGGAGRVRSVKTSVSDFSRTRGDSARQGLASIERFLITGVGVALVIVGFVFWLGRSRRVDEEDWDE